MKKILALALCAALFLTAVGCGTASEENDVNTEAPVENEQTDTEAPVIGTSGIANPWSDFDTLAEAEAKVGFSLGLSETIADSYTATVFRAMKTSMLEVRYSKGENEVTVRKTATEAEDISGVYAFEARTVEDVNGVSVTYCRETESESYECPMKVLLNCGGYSWSIYAPNGFAEGECAAFVTAVLANAN